MKIYIDWDNAEWRTDEEQFFDNLIGNGELKTYSDFLAYEFENCLDELLILSEKEKESLREKYKMDLALEFETKVKYGKLNCTVLNVETKDNVTVKEIL